MNNKIINIAVIAHVDAGKSTLVDALLDQSGVFRDNEKVVDCIMDSNDLERERGITIYSKNCSIEHKGIKINIIDTPGHADFSSEVERILKTVDTVILLVDASEGPMPQTRFVLKKSLEKGLNPILLINKIDKKDQRAEEVVDMTFDLFIDLGATDEQTDFPIVYGIAKDGIAKLDMADESDNLDPLFDTIVEHVGQVDHDTEANLQFQISSLDYDDYVGRLGIGRVKKGSVRKNQVVSVYKRDGSVQKCKIGRVYSFEGLNRVEQEEVFAGDIAVVSGIEDISIGETIGLVDQVEPLEMIKIDEPTISMNFLPNDSPFVGRSGKFLTNREIRSRLMKELESNVGLRVEDLPGNKGFKVSGRGELHLSVLIEKMRREGYELSISNPEVLFKKEDNKVLEPIEEVIVSVPDEHSGVVISKLNLRKGMMTYMNSEDGYTTLNYDVPTRGLLGYRSEFINDTRGEGTLVSSFKMYDTYKGEIEQRTNGVLVSMNSGVAMAYSLVNLSERGTMIIKPTTDIYEGMIIGINKRSEDMEVNPCKNKKLTNVRSSGSDDALTLAPPRIFDLEDALEFIDDDELVEVTPDSIRIRKKILDKTQRHRANKKIQKK